MWLLGAATAVCGDSEICLRLPASIVATINAFLIYALARRLYDRQVAFWAAIVYATLPAVSLFAVTAMPEVLLAFFIIAGLLALANHFDRPTISSGIVLGFVLGLGFLTDYAMAYLPFCTLLYVAATRQTHGILQAPGTWLAVAIAVLVAAPSFAWNGQSELISLAQALSFVSWNSWGFKPDATLLFIGLQFALFGPILLFVLLSSVLARRNPAPRASADRFLLFHSVPILAVLLVQVLIFKAKAHWALPAFPAATVFVTALLLRHGYQRLVLISTALHVGVMAGVLTLSIFADRFADVPAFNRLLGWREFAQEMERVASVSEVNQIVISGGNKVSESIYYLRDADLEILAFNPRGRRATDEFERRHSWAYGDPETILLATARDPTAYGIPIGTADKIGEFPVQSFLSEEGIFSLYRVNPPTETELPQEGSVAQ